MFVGNACAESYCAGHCASGVTCDCTWNASTNTLVLNSGTFDTNEDSEVKNVIVAGDNIVLWDDPFDGVQNITLLGKNIKLTGAGIGLTAQNYTISPESAATLTTDLDYYSIAFGDKYDDSWRITCTTDYVECHRAMINKPVFSSFLKRYEAGEATIFKISEENLQKLKDSIHSSSKLYTTDEALSAVTGNGNNRLSIYFK